MSKQDFNEAVPVSDPMPSTTLLTKLVRTLSVVEDPRSSRGVRHPLVNVLTIAVLGCMCGCDDAEALEDWGRKEAHWLSEFLELTHGVPSQDVYLRMFAAIDPVSFRVAFQTWMGEVFAILGVGSQIAIDGQTHRRSASKRSGKKPLHMVHALACEAGLVLGQVATEEKSNEITAIPALLDVLDLRGALVSIDAMGTQVKIARKIVKGGGDYLLALKGNQSSLSKQVTLVFEKVGLEAAFEVGQDTRRSTDEVEPPHVETDTQVNAGHGRIEKRTARVMTGFEPWVPAAGRWADLQCLVEITATRENLTTGKVSEEKRYYISSRALTAAEANEGVRAHWMVENRLHWCLDMTFGQDANCTRTGNAAENLGLVRHFALNIIRNYKDDRYSVPRRRRLCDFRPDYREKVLSAIANA